jgi:protein TonB
MIHPPPEAFVRAVEAVRLRREALSRTRSPGRILGWAAAAGLTLGLHAGLYLLLTRRDDPPPAWPEMPAAVMITLSPIAVTARSEVDNTTTGPPADARTQAEPEPVEEAPPPPAPEPVVDVPPPPPDVKPQAVLPPKPPEARTAEKPVEKEKPKKPVEKPKPVDRKPKPVETRKPVERKEKPSVAARAGGGPRSDRRTADVTAAAAAGSAVSEASRASWQNEVRARMVRAKRFPSEARGQTGVAVVAVTFGASGSASGVRLVTSSGNAAFDAEAMAVMYRAAPYPPPPGGRTTSLTVPLVFRR